MTFQRWIITVCICCMLGIIGCTLVQPVNTRPEGGFVQGGHDRFERLAALGNVEAMNNLGVIYTHGMGVFMNHQKALKLFRLAAARGNADAKHNLKIPQMVAAAQQPAPMKTQPQPQVQSQPQPQPQPQAQQLVPSARSMKIEDAKESCILIGFKPKTEKFEDCVLKLSK